MKTLASVKCQKKNFFLLFIIENLKSLLMKWIVVALLIASKLIFSCEELKITYPTIETYADWEIENCLSCAEDAFLQGDPQRAIELFDQSIDFCEKKDASDVRIVRALFGHMIAQAYLGEETAALSDVELLDKAIRQFQCEEAASNVYFAYGKPILGEDEISIEDCVKRVENTVKGIDQILVQLDKSSCGNFCVKAPRLTHCKGRCID